MTTHYLTNIEVKSIFSEYSTTELEKKAEDTITWASFIAELIDIGLIDEPQIDRQQRGK